MCFISGSLGRVGGDASLAPPCALVLIRASLHTLLLPVMVSVRSMRILAALFGGRAIVVCLLMAAACFVPTWAWGPPSPADSGERIKQLLAGKMQSDSFGWFALRDFTYCLGGNAPDPLSRKLGVQLSAKPASSSAIAADSAGGVERMIGTGDSVVVLYHPHHKNKAIAWCNTLVAFSSTKHVSCHRALPTCQRCEAVPDGQEPQHHFHYPPPGASHISPFQKRQLTDKDATTDDTQNLQTAIHEFQDYCENKLTLAVRADCPLHIVQDWNDEPPFDLVRFCMASSADDGFTLNPQLAKAKPKGVVDPNDVIVPPSTS